MHFLALIVPFYIAWNAATDELFNAVSQPKEEQEAEVAVVSVNPVDPVDPVYPVDPVDPVDPVGGQSSAVW